MSTRQMVFCVLQAIFLRLQMILLYITVFVFLFTGMTFSVFLVKLLTSICFIALSCLCVWLSLVDNKPIVEFLLKKSRFY